MRIGMAAIAAGVMVAAVGCGSNAERDAALYRVWGSFDTVTQKAFCEASIQNGDNFYGPAKGLAAKAGSGVTEHDAFQFLLEVCPDAWLVGPDRF